MPNPHQIEIELSLPDSASARRIEAELRNQGNQVGATAETMSTRHFLALSRAVNLNDGALGALQRHSRVRIKHLARRQHHYNHHRRCSALGYKPLISRIPLNNLSNLNT